VSLQAQLAGTFAYLDTDEIWLLSHVAHRAYISELRLHSCASEHKLIVTTRTMRCFVELLHTIQELRFAFSHPLYSRHTVLSHTCMQQRLIGRRFAEPCVQAQLRHWPFDAIEGPRGKVRVTHSNGCTTVIQFFAVVECFCVA
jgi:hypothetical protein